MGAGRIEGHELIIGQVNQQTRVLTVGDGKGFGAIHWDFRCIGQHMACLRRRFGSLGW